MITNERQYRITRAQFNKLKIAVESFDFEENFKQVKDELLVKAQIDALNSEYENLRMQIQEYEVLKSGAIKILQASTLEELPIILIKARIAKGLSQRELAQSMGLKEQQIQRYEAEEYASASLTRLVEVANTLGLNIKEVAELGRLDRPINVENTEFAWAQFPIKEMYRRNWFEGFTGSMSEAVVNAEELLKQYVTDALEEPVRAAAKQHVRLGGKVDKCSLIAWQCRVINMAKKIKLQNKFEKSLLTDSWFNGLVKLSRQKEWTQKTIKFLEDTGIRLVIVPHLSHTHLDGAAFLINLGPIVGMTLRYDRIDNFWFVLIHELLHIKKHLSKGKVESIFDDLEVDAHDVEKEADEITSEILVPSDKWGIALARYVRSEETIKEFSREIGVAHSIVAGRIRREANNYIILKNMVGQGGVRKHFAEIDFSY